MKQPSIKKIHLLGLTLISLAVPSSVLYARDLQQNGSIKIGTFHKEEHSGLAKVTIQDAISAATKNVPGKAIEAQLESKDGYLVYEVKVISPDKKITDVYVDAGNSAILGSEQESKGRE